MRSLLVLSLLLTASFHSTQAYTHTERTRTIMQHNGVPKMVCDSPYGVMQLGDKIRINCVEFNCSPYAFIMSGIGYNAGVIHLEGCEIKRLDDCCYQFVEIDDPHTLCMATRCPRPLKS